MEISPTFEIELPTKRVPVQLAKPRLLNSKASYIKVRLYFQTYLPKHIRSIQLAQNHCQPPYTEDVCVLLPRMHVFSLLETFLPAFEHLKTVGILPIDSTLQNFRILEEDNPTLAYAF